MNNKLMKILTVFLITAITIPAIPVLAGEFDHPEGDAMWIQPDTLTGPAGTILDLTIWTNISAIGFTYQCQLEYNVTVLRLVSISHGLTDPKYWLSFRDYGVNTLDDGISTPPPAYGEVSPGINFTKIGGTCQGDDFIPPGTTGKLAVARFEVILGPDKYESVATTINLDNLGTFILDFNLDDAIFTIYNADYSYDWELPDSPYLAVDPVLTEFGPDPPSAIGETFTVDVYIMDLDPNWALHNVTLDLLFNDTVIELLGAPAFDALWATTSWGIVAGATISLEAKDPTSTPFGDVLIATLTFNVTHQGNFPPQAYDDTSPLDIENELLFDTIEYIPTLDEIDGNVIVKPLRELALAWLEVSDVTMGPEPSRGAHFNVTVDIVELDPAWKLTGVEFRLAYPADLIAPVATYEGSFLYDYAVLQNGTPPDFTWFSSFFEPANLFPAHVLVGQLILPNATGMWNPPAPGCIGGRGTIAIIEFEVVYQSFGHEPNCSELEIITQLGVGIDSWTTQSIVDIPLGPPVNGTYCITTDLPGRNIDLYGGALNRGYGSLPFPEPFGGQGPHNPMDLVIPQAEVHLFAYVTYNYWPVQNKLVGFEVEGPMGILLKRTAATDADGFATISFEMPWPCDRPEEMFGVYTVTATVDISDTRLNDTMEFHYDYMVRIWKVTTDMFEYNHCDEVEITIEYGTHAQQMYPALFSVLIMDELIVPIGMALVETEIGGAEFCSYMNGSITVSIHIPKWAFAGLATIHVNAYDRDPTEGGIAWTPEFEPLPIIAIQPY